NADAKAIDIPLLAAAPSPPPPARHAQAADVTQGPDRGRRVAGFVIGGTGIVALGVGAFFGIEAIQKHSDAAALCPASPCSNPTGVAINDDARAYAAVSTVAIAVGIVGVGAGAVLLLTARSKQTSIASGFGRALLRGTF